MEIRIDRFFELVEEYYGDVKNIPVDAIKFQGEKLLELHNKVDDIHKLELDNGEVMYPSANHIIYDVNDK